MISSWIYSVKNMFISRDAARYLGATRKVRIEGINFTIKKIDVMDYLEGGKVMLQMADEYKVGPAKNNLPSQKKIKEHYKDVFMAGVVKPALSRKSVDKVGNEISVEEIFRSASLCEKLYTHIIGFTYGNSKKKVCRAILAAGF